MLFYKGMWYNLISLSNSNILFLVVASDFEINLPWQSQHPTKLYFAIEKSTFHYYTLDSKTYASMNNSNMMEYT